MKRIYTLIVLAGCLFLAAACGAKHYNITTTDGKSYVSQEEPKFDNESKSYSFEDLDGHKVILRQTDIKEIKSFKK